jgi:spermidine/putrescine transport system ATP-binding protein
MIGGFDAADVRARADRRRDMTHAPPYARPVNTVFQDYALFPHMTCATTWRTR